jgi:hypothetical protein
MKALVVYESLYGNTAEIARAIAASLRVHRVDVGVGPISRYDPLDRHTFDLLVVGGPTHAHGMSWKGTRETAINDAKNTFAEPTTSPGLRAWLHGLPSGDGRAAAAFDTRFEKPVAFVGSAARAIARRLGSRGYRVIDEPTSFFVTTDSHLEDGQLDAATDWAIELVDRMSARTASR